MLSTAATGEPTFSVIERVRTLIVDDHPMFRLALGEVLSHLPELDVVAEAGSVAEANACLAHLTLDLAIVDVVLPDGRGFAFVDHVLNVQPDCKVLALSAIDEPKQIAAMLRSGASGFALKSQPVGEIVEALRCVLGGSRSIPSSARAQTEKLLAKSEAWPLETLTPRERAVFELLIAGHTNDGIAAKLVLSRGTVETYRLRVMTKLAARSLGDLLQLAVRHGLVS
jgi:DNA-binding NarL/FixJ family response regulator